MNRETEVQRDTQLIWGVSCCKLKEGFELLSHTYATHYRLSIRKEIQLKDLSAKLKSVHITWNLVYKVMPWGDPESVGVQTVHKVSCWDPKWTEGTCAASGSFGWNGRQKGRWYKGCQSLYTHSCSLRAASTTKWEFIIILFILAGDQTKGVIYARQMLYHFHISLS
jgi:hypothetical protein